MRPLRPLLTVALIVTILAAMAPAASAQGGGCTFDGELRCGANARTDGRNGTSASADSNIDQPGAGSWVPAPTPPANALDCNTIGAAEAPVNITTAVATDIATGAAFIGEFCVVLPADAVFVPPAPPTLEEVLAAAAVPQPTLRLNPAVGGLTGMATHAWYDGATTIGPITVQIRGYTVSGTATVEQVTFDMGRPDRAAQQTYTINDPAGFGTAEQPAVRHTYETKGPVAVIVETVWHGLFTITGNGLIPRTVDLGLLPLPGTVVYPVAEGRSVLIR